MNRTILGLLLLLSLTAICCDRPSANPTVVMIVRHAEKAADTDDTPLSEAGARRAQALVRVAEAAGVDAIYSSQFKRNHDTVQPVADRLGIAVTEAPVNLDAPGDYGARLARQIMQEHSGRTVLVVGHRNTIQALVESLSGKAVDPIADEYSDLFIVVAPPRGPARLIKARYGEAKGM
ncbi:MAG TPA: phosphoglycerate mutase family protein [Blastocatellia bacterium]|jgi:broad specificity phosphatase PhoE|nr:phosphoglycerate mutase family protein [Blastocatellia bacterium]